MLNKYLETYNINYISNLMLKKYEEGILIYSAFLNRSVNIWLGSSDDFCSDNLWYKEIMYKQIERSEY